MSRARPSRRKNRGVTPRFYAARARPRVAGERPFRGFFCAENLREMPTITASQLAELTGVSVKGVEWQLNSLKKEGVVKRIGPDKGGHWEVLSKGE